MPVVYIDLAAINLFMINWGRHLNRHG